MDGTPSTIRCAHALSRLVIVVVVLLLGHDAMMAMNPHGTNELSSAPSHHELTIEECGPSDGQVQQTGFFPLLPLIAFAESGNVAWLGTNSALSERTVAPAIDADSRRAFLQVFLN